MNNESNTKIIEIIEDSSFTFDGYQVVRGEFFAHVYEPSITLNNYKVSVNTACIKKLPNIDYVQILVNPETKKLAVRPCTEDVKDSVKWCTDKRSPKQIYRIDGIAVTTDDSTVAILFHLNESALIEAT